MSHFDLFVIGGGSGGVACARSSAALGAKVGLAEADRLGGTCVNRGCVPKKFMVYASQGAEDLCNTWSLGWEGDVPRFNWQKLRESVQTELRRLNGVYANMLSKGDVDLYRGAARFVDAKTVEVDGRKITADRFVIATGGRPHVPDIPGKELALVSDDAFLLDRLPSSMAIVGGGYIAQEFAGIFNGLGVKVDQVVRCHRLLNDFDRDLAEHLRQEQEKKGVGVLCATHVERVEEVDGKVRLHFKEQQSGYYDQVLFATGRTPNSRGLGLEQIGVGLKENGAVVVDEFMQTTVPGIYAIGDVTDRVNLTPVAIHEGRLFSANHFGGQHRTMDYTNIPTTIFSQPPLGSVGLSEQEANEAYDDVVIYRSRFRPMKYALGEIQEKTLMKLVVDGRTDRVLGAHMVGPDAAEILQGFAVALKAGATKADFDRTIGIHPSSAEEFVTMREPAID